MVACQLCGISSEGLCSAHYAADGFLSVGASESRVMAVAGAAGARASVHGLALLHSASNIAADLPRQVASDAQADEVTHVQLG